MKNYQVRLDAWQKAKYAPPPEQDPTPRQPSMIAMAPMRDGVKLFTELFLPEGPGKFPVIFHRSPYPMYRPSRHDQWPIDRYLEAGYAFVFQLTRGQGQSEGTFHFLKDEVEDGYDSINWLAEQTWCNGNVGMEGSSYAGGTQLSAARAKPEALKCIMPTAFVGHCVSAFPFIGGVPARGILMQWYPVANIESWDELDAPYGDMSVLKHPLWGEALRKRPLVDAAEAVLAGDKLASWREVMSHPLDDDYWQPIHFTDEELSELDLPMFITDGWYDMTVGPIDYFQRLEKVDPNNANRYLLVGPWGHAQTFRSQLHSNSHGEHKMPDNGAVDLLAQRIAFFDRYLKGDKNTTVQADRVRVYITGAPGSDANQWRNFPTFPVPGTKERCLYLHSTGNAHNFPQGGALSWDRPNQEPTDSYVYDPGLPTPCEAEPFRDRRDIEIRTDVLTYTSPPMDAPLTILGEIRLILHAASDAPDTDWFALMTEVYPDGKSVAFHGTLPALRSRYREGFDREVFLKPNEATEFRLSLGPAGHQIAAGHCIRLSIFSANFPACDPNTNTGNVVATDTEQRKARHAVFHDVMRASHLIIPLVTLNL